MSDFPQDDASPVVICTMDDSQRQFVRLMTAHERLVYSYILSLVPNWADADEILQETNIRLWERFESFTPGTNFGAWATRVAYYQVLTWRKQKSRQRMVFSQEAVEALAADPFWEEDQFEVRRRLLGDCVSDLPPRSRDLLKQCYSHGSKIKEIAASMGRTPASLYKALERVRVALHGCVERKLHQETH